jgi:fatty acid desaturase
MTGTAAVDRRAARRSTVRPPRPPSDYSVLLRRVQSAGLSNRRYGYYAVKTAALLVALVAVGVGVARLGDHWAQLALAVAAAVVFTQILFLSHDAAHRQIFRSHRWNDRAALLAGTLLGGVSLAWWNNKHTRHHAAPNQVGRDPDIVPAAVHFYPLARDGAAPIAAWIRARQGWWFFPLSVLEALNLHLQSVRTVLGRGPIQRRRTEIAMLAVRLAAYPAALFLILSPGIAAAFLAVQIAVSGVYLAAAFSAGHVGMPIVPQDSRIDFLRRQVLTSRNVAGGRLASLAMGGLNYQIEHHLFPNLPRPSLRKVRPLVLDYCRDHDIAYQQVTIGRAWRLVCTHLNRVGRSGRVLYQCPTLTSLRPR